MKGSYYWYGRDGEEAFDKGGSEAGLKMKMKMVKIEEEGEGKDCVIHDEGSEVS